jgi:hypothetical protein
MGSMFDNDGASNAPAVPPQLAAGLDLFAASWLEEWSRSGGFVSIDTSGRAGFGYAEYHYSPAYQPVPEGLSDAVSRAYEGFTDGKYNGKMRGMLDLLATLPHGRDAIKAHMLAHGLRCYAAPTKAAP